LIRRRGLEPPALADEERAKFDPLSKLPAGRLPLLILHGDEDDLIVPAEAKVALDAAGSRNKTLRMIAGHGHNDISFSEDYWRAITWFVGDLVDV
jgi:fermentation-respiration switch protein FrsA (DUF1100 family)